MIDATHAAIHDPSRSTEVVGLQMPLPRRLWKVGDLIRATGLTRQTLHTYTLLGLITEEERTPGGQRLFGDEVFARLRRIDALKRRGLRLSEIAARLNQPRKPRNTRQATNEGSSSADEQG